ncbi:MAG TPA: signal recognition particle receptor subunit alpha [Candidatus Nanoarchaeia archaeon]|nr:signal recognition particle receptor subunit alpha [Candidatus Nanoarchaeia archaeon]
MVLDALGSSLKNTLKKIAQSVFVNDKLLDELVREIQRALLQADVDVKLVFELTNSIKQRAKEDKPPTSVTQREYLVTIVYQELVKFFGEEKKGITITKKKPFKIMMLGLYGSGKTTSIGKIAKYYQKRSYKIAVVGLDVHRPAASLQLQQLADQLKIPAFIDSKEKNALKVWKKYEKDYADFDILLVDTAGRDALDKELVEEIEEVNKAVQADERLLVLSADIGQAARKQAQQFHDSCGVTGVIVTKLDGTAKGGGSLSACAATKAPIKFIGVGEKMEDLEEFNPAGFVGRLLGMGDIEALLEKAKEAMTEEQAEDLGKKMMQGDFSLIDLHEQLSAMRKMGPLSKIMEMIPGMGKIQMPKEALQVQEEKIILWKHIMSSCTKQELEHPDTLTKNRIERIATGSGVAVKDVRDLLKQYHQSKKFMKMMKGKNPEKMMKKFGAMKFK